MSFECAVYGSCIGLIQICVGYLYVFVLIFYMKTSEIKWCRVYGIFREGFHVHLIAASILPKKTYYVRAKNLVNVLSPLHLCNIELARFY